MSVLVIERGGALSVSAEKTAGSFGLGLHNRTAARQKRIADSRNMKPLPAPKAHSQTKSKQDVTPRPNPAARDILKIG
jgi:hypothetical protein